MTTVNETASVIFSSGSNRFGDFGNDTHSFTGSVQISGSITTVGSSTATSFSGAIASTNGVVSGSSQITSFGFISSSASIPTGTVSGSSQINVMSTTNIARLATTGSNTFSAQQTISSSAEGLYISSAGSAQTLRLSSTTNNNTLFRMNNFNNNFYDIQNQPSNNSLVIDYNDTTRLEITSGGTVQPGANGTQDLGSSALRWSTIYTSDLSLNNGIGDWTIVEGEDDLFLYNNKKGKVYKFALTEVDPNVATPKKS